jgi:pilus assembly protein FimV
MVEAPEQATKKILVKAGDTASKIAENTKSAGVSLDQMLVALLRSNPDVFLKGNINRIRAGAVMNMPSAELAQSVPTAEATQIVIAQSKDFNEFRRNLASNAPAAAVVAADRKASGAISAKIEEKKPAAATPDKLTLSKGALKAQQDEAKIAKERADKDTQTRAAELAKNINDLKKLGAAASAVPVQAPVMAASAPKIEAPIVPIAPVVAPEPVPVASAPQTPASVAPQSKPKPMPAPVAAPVEEPATTFLDELLGDPMVPAAAGGLIALLGGFAFWRARQRKNNSAQLDSSFLESRLQPDSFFGASGGQHIDTSGDGGMTGSSMMYSPSQLDSADDVDPVAEADVYLAYGRDLQAEEILKEALRVNPGRLAIHTKLLEIFAKRRDAIHFEAAAAQAYKLTGGDNPEWTRICEMGLDFDPANPMYLPGGAPAEVKPQETDADDARSFGTTIAFSTQPELPAASGNVDLDLDLDFSLDDEPVNAISPVADASVTPTGHDQTIKMTPPQAMQGLDMDMNLDAGMDLELDNEAPALPEISLSMDGLSLVDEESPPALNFDTTSAMPVQTQAPTAPAPINDSGMLEFDLGSLSLDLDTPAPTPTEAPWSENEDPLETKLALAEEFVSIGDEDGARALIEEVVAEATGDMRAKAQRALANLS